MLESVTVETFAPHVGTRCRIVASEGLAIDAVLAQAHPFGPAAPSTTRAPFSVVFLGPLTPVLPQRIYRVEHATLPPMDLFLVPIGSEKDRMRYEAIFA